MIDADWPRKLFSGYKNGQFTLLTCFYTMLYCMSQFPVPVADIWKHVPPDIESQFRQMTRNAASHNTQIIWSNNGTEYPIDMDMWTRFIEYFDRTNP